MSPNLLSKLSRAPRKFVSVYIVGVRMGGVGVKLVSFGTHKSQNHKLGDIICRHIPLFPSLIRHFHIDRKIKNRLYSSSQ